MIASVKIDGLVPLQQKIRRLESMEPVTAGLGEATLYLKGKIAVYPRVRRGPMVGGFKSDRQRRKVFAMIREGEIPYRRGQSSSSQDLGQKWTTEVKGLAGRVGNNVPYGPLVQDRQRQAAYHKITGWITIQDVAEGEGDKAVEIVAQHIDRALEE